MTRELRKSLATLIMGSLLFSAAPAFALGGASGTHIKYKVDGEIGAVLLNPYKIAPLTAVIKNGGYVLSDVSVKVLPKTPDGITLEYKVSDTECRTHGGIPIFGLYPDTRNTMEVSYTKTAHAQSKRITAERYRIRTAPAFIALTGYSSEANTFPKAEVKKMSPEFKDRLYLINNMLPLPANASQAVWNNPTGGTLEWVFPPQNAIYDSHGDLRWYMEPSAIYDPADLNKTGIMMGFRQTPDGAFVWGYGQRYAKYDLMGREIFNRKLPMAYADFSHATHPMPNGHILLRVASADYVFPDGKKHVRTVRDVIIELDENARVVDEWRLFDILDPYRDTILKVLDQGAVCLNIDPTQAGKTLSAEALKRQEENQKYGDIVGTGPGRNWVHVNSVDYDPTDDSIIISSRHQSAIIKIGRDHQVKWILGAPKGWKAPFADKVLKPVLNNGKPAKCDASHCEDPAFDWIWTQHTAWRIPTKSDQRYVYLSVFDNGDGRGMEQPPFPTMKYSRAVIYKIDQKKHTVEQLWEYGKERGHEWFSPVTSLTEYQADKNSVFVYSATAGANYNLKKGGYDSQPNPFLNEFKWGEKEPAVEIQFKDSEGYQAMPIDLKKAFNTP